MSTNGHNGTTGAIVRRVLLDSGVEVDVSPLSPHAVVKLRDKAKTTHPFPDENEFRKPLPNSAIEGDTFVDRDDPEYRRLYSEAAIKQAEFLLEGISDLCFDYPRGREQLMQDFRPLLDKQRKLYDLPEDEWLATFYYAIIASPADKETLTLAAMSELPISMEEVIEGENGLRVFRYKVQGRRPSTLAAGWKKLASGLEKGSKGQS